MYFKKLCFTSLLAVGLLNAQSSVGLNVNDEDLEVRASIDLSALTSSYSEGTSYTLDASYLHTDRDNLATLGASAESTLQGVEGLALGLGMKSVFTDNFIAVPFFVKASYALPIGYSVPKTSLGTTFAYAPSVLTFRDGESYRELRAEADMELVTDVHLFAGYRNIHTEYETHDRTFNNSFYGGMKLSF